MRKLLLTTILLLLTTTLVFAEIPIYCPHCKRHIYNYQKDEIAKGKRLETKDLKPADDNIEKPNEFDAIICPFDKAPLNGWEYWAKKQGFKSFVMAYYAISLLSKKDGKWIWVGDEMPYLNMNEVK